MLHYAIAAMVGDLNGLAFILNQANYLLTTVHQNCRMRGAISLFREGRLVFTIAPCYLDWKTKITLYEDARDDFVAMNFINYFLPSIKTAVTNQQGLADINNMFNSLANSNWFFIKFTIERLLLWPA